MPRKPRITAVPVEQPEGLMVANDLPEEKTDAEQMTEILQEVKEEPKVAVSDAVVEVKPKAKRASRAKPKEEPLEAEPIEEQILTQEPKEEARIDDKVACPDCGKQMSAKTLKYSHVANCVTKKPKTKTEKTDEQQYPPQVGEITEELIEHHIRTRSRAARALRRETMMNNLVQSAFWFSERFYIHIDGQLNQHAREQGAHGEIPKQTYASDRARSQAGRSEGKQDEEQQHAKSVVAEAKQF